METGKCVIFLPIPNFGTEAYGGISVGTEYILWGYFILTYVMRNSFTYLLIFFYNLFYDLILCKIVFEHNRVDGQLQSVSSFCKTEGRCGVHT